MSSQRSTTYSAEAAAQALVVLLRRLRSRMRQVPSEGLTPSQTSVLLRLYKDGASSTTLLAAAEGVRPQSMTAILNVLRDKEMIVCQADPNDGRRQIITLSPVGRDRAVVDRQGRHEWLARTMEERFGPDELRIITDALSLLADLAED